MAFVSRCLKDARALFCLAALCLALPFLFEGLYVLTFLGVAVLFCAADRVKQDAGPRSTFALGFGFAFVYHLAVYHWLLALHPLSAASLSGAVSLLVVLLAWLGAAAIHAAFFGCAFCLWGLCRRRVASRWSLPLFLISLLSAEAFTSVGTLAFPWARFGLPLAQESVLVSVAALVGPLGAEALLFAFGLLCARGFTAPRRTLAFVLAAILLLVQVGFGFVWRGGFTPPADGEGVTLRVAAVQTAYSYEEKWTQDPLALRQACRSAALSAAESGADVIVFPESVLASGVVRGDSNEAFFASLSEECDAVIVAGCILRDGENTYNATAVFDASGLVSFNAKRHLVPFGEYLPWRGFFEIFLPAVSAMTYYRSDYTVGEGGVCGKALGTTFGGMVCFDTLFSSLAVDSAREGAHVLLAPTNDAWFKDTVASRHHLWHGIWRAAETGRAFVQAANVGISAVVHANGAVEDTVALGQSGVCCGTVTLSDVKTPYVQTGELVAPLSVLGLFGLVLYLYLPALLSRFGKKKGGAPRER